MFVVPFVCTSSIFSIGGIGIMGTIGMVGVGDMPPATFGVGPNAPDCGPTPGGGITGGAGAGIPPASCGAAPIAPGGGIVDGDGGIAEFSADG